MDRGPDAERQKGKMMMMMKKKKENRVRRRKDLGTGCKQKNSIPGTSNMLIRVLPRTKFFAHVFAQTLTNCAVTYKEVSKSMVTACFA
jgi:hypothetical protein